MDLVIRNGTFVTASSVYPADVGIAGEQIVALGKRLRGEVELDATGCYVVPGAVDPHVHLQMPLDDGSTEASTVSSAEPLAKVLVSADDFTSGTIAAACGGTTTVIDFVEPAEGQPLPEALAARRAEADGRVAIDYGLHMTIPTWHAAHSKELESLPELVAEGVSSFKLYQAYEGLWLDDAQLYAVLRAVAAVGGLPIIHSENGPVCERLRAEALAAGHTAPRYHALTRLPRQEAEAVSRAIDLAALAGSPLYIVHISCAEALARLAAARCQGEPVYGETCPQYLVLTAEMLDRSDGERFVCSPPLRDQADQEALWDALARDDLDVLATDHCPFTAAEKASSSVFTEIPGGLPSIEARLSLTYSLGVLTGRLSLERWVEVCCTAPARIFGLSRKGQLAPGFDADLVIFDPQAEVVLGVEMLHEQVDWTPYEGLRLTGWPRDVLSRGRVIVRDREFIGEPGWGCFVLQMRG